MLSTERLWFWQDDVTRHLAGETVNNFILRSDDLAIKTDLFDGVPSPHWAFLCGITSKVESTKINRKILTRRRKKNCDKIVEIDGAICERAGLDQLRGESSGLSRRRRSTHTSRIVFHTYVFWTYWLPIPYRFLADNFFPIQFWIKEILFWNVNVHETSYRSRFFYGFTYFGTTVVFENVSTADNYF